MYTTVQRYGVNMDQNYMKVHHVDLNMLLAVKFTFEIWSGITYRRKRCDAEVYSLERLLKYNQEL